MSHELIIKRNKKVSDGGFSLVEIVVALGIFALIVSSVAFFSAGSFRSSENARMKIEAIARLREMTHAVAQMKNESWAGISELPVGVQKHVAFQTGRYTIVDGPLVEGGITVYFVAEPVYRDGDGNVVESGGVEDPHSRTITFSAEWEDTIHLPVVLTSEIILNDWNTKRWIETLKTEFDQGTRDLTITTENVDGEVQLESILYADWCNPTWAMTASDLPGSGVARALTVVPGEVFAGTGENASGLSFIDISLDEQDPPNVTVLGTFDGYKTNDVFGESDYAYISTDTNSKEIVIIDIRTLPFHMEGYFDAPGNGNGNSVAVSGTTGFMVTGTKFYAFDLSSKVGARLQVGNVVNLAGTGESIKIWGGYAFVATTSTTKQLQVINISNPLSMTEVAWAQVNGAGGTDVFISDDGNRAYITTAVSTTKPELFIINVSEKAGARSTISSYETTGMSPLGVARVTDDRLIVVGTSGEEYQVINIENELSPTRCGGINNDLRIYDIVPHTNLAGNAYSYIVTGDASNEFKIIRGGPGGGGGANGQGFAPAGTFESRVFDTGSDQTYYYFMEWDETIPAGSDLRFQVRAGATLDLSSVPWIGPDGTGTSYFAAPQGEQLPSSLNGNRYVQFKGLYSSDTVYTPVLGELRITYQ